MTTKETGWPFPRHRQTAGGWSGISPQPWPRWLINISLGAGIVVNLVYTFHDPAWFKALTQIGLNLIALFLTIRTSQVFPFDFSEYRFEWEPLTRFILVMVGIGTLIGIVVEIVTLVRSLVLPLPTDSTSHSDHNELTSTVERRNL